MRVVFSCLAAVLVLFPAQPVIGRADDPVDSSGDGLELIQSELDYLEQAGHRMSAVFRKAAPAEVLERVGMKARLRIGVRGTLPADLRLTAAFSDATAKEILEWFAREVPVFYKAEPPDKLLVVCPPKEAKP